MAKLDTVVELLLKNGTLNGAYDDHPLHGKDNGCRECHIEPDWLLKYMIDKEKLIMVAMRTGTHSDLRFC